MRSHNMKAIFLLGVTLALVYADPLKTSPDATESSGSSSSGSTSSKDVKSATVVAAASSATPSKPAAAAYYATRTPTFVQLLQRPIFGTHHQSTGGIPQTMLIIAQPALIPHNLLYNQASTMHAQQLLNYFHGNPAAKYQLLYGYQPSQQPANPSPVYYATQQQHLQQQQPPPQQQQQYQQYFAPQHFANYLQHFASVPQSHYATAQQPAATYTSAMPEVQYTAQPAAATSPAQQYVLHQPASHFYSQGPQTFTPQTPTAAVSPTAASAGQGIKTAAPIITGLENFTPEQQAQIKEQLSQHFGGAALTQLNGNSVQVQQPETYTTAAKYRIEVEKRPEVDYVSVPVQPYHHQQHQHHLQLQQLQYSRGEHRQPQEKQETQTEANNFKAAEVDIDPYRRHHHYHHAQYQQQQQQQQQQQEQPHASNYATQTYNYRTSQ